jgi:GNAT superfamily N-acetyltransferase
MEVLIYDPSMLDRITALYNRSVGNVPHCYPVLPEEFATELPVALGGRAKRDLMKSETLLVAQQRGSPLGFIHAGVVSREDLGDTGVIRFFCYEPGNRAAGRALLTGAEKHIVERGMNKIHAYPQEFRYRFYHFEHAYLSMKLGSVEGLLGMAGYERRSGEIFMDYPEYPPLEPSPARIPVGVSLEWKEGRGKRPGLRIHAHFEGRHVGICCSVSAGEFSSREEAQDWFCTEWLGINDEFQGKGLGRHVLQRALLELHRVGYRHASLSTDWHNYRALLFYTNYGYQVVDRTYSWKKDL